MSPPRACPKRSRRVSQNRRVPQVSPGLRDLGSYQHQDSTGVVRGFGPGPKFAKTGQTWGTPRSRLSAHLQGYTYGPKRGPPARQRPGNALCPAHVTVLLPDTLVEYG